MVTTVTVTPAVAPSSSVSAFPSSAVAAILRHEFAEAVTAVAALEGVALPQSATALGQHPLEVDSLTAVEILCAIEPLVGMELKSSVVRAGGYSSIDDATTTLLARIEKAWKKHHGVIP
mgnify:CR=1 FL=1